MRALSAGVAALLALAGVPAQARTSVAAAATPALNGAVFDRAWTLVERHYWNDARLGERWVAARERYRPAALAAGDSRALYAVLARMLAEVGDSHVFAIDPAQRAFEAVRERADDAPRGAFGFSTWQQAGAWRVFAVVPEGPAARAGVRIGWQLARVDGAAVDEDWHPAIGARSTLDFLDETGAPKRLVLTAGALSDAPPWRARMLAGGVLLATLDTFARGADDWLRGEIAQGRPSAIVLDLRENGGGEAIAVARVAGLFFAEKRTLIERVARGKPLDVPVLRYGRDDGWLGPLAVLVGPRSASGAEALAALIDDAGRGATVGQRTAGALTGAALFDLPDGGQLSVAEFDIRTGAGRRLEGVGFVPRHVVAADEAALRRGADPVLAAAVRLLATERGQNAISRGSEAAFGR